MEGAMSETLSPSEALSGEVVDRLIAAGLLRADKREALIAKIAGGQMKGSDWKVEIDLAQLKGAQK
jgi:hypothetical protein